MGSWTGVPMLQGLLVVMVAILAPAAKPPGNTLCSACGGPVHARNGQVTVRDRT